MSEQPKEEIRTKTTGSPDPRKERLQSSYELFMLMLDPATMTIKIPASSEVLDRYYEAIYGQ